MLGIEGVSLLAIGGALGGFAGALAKTVFDKWLSRRQDREMERYRYEQRMREQAAKIAELIAVGPFLPAGGEDDANYRRVRQIAFELLLVLPDELYQELKLGIRREGGRNEFTVLLAIKEHLRGEPTSLTDEDILFYHPKAAQANAQVAHLGVKS